MGPSKIVRISAYPLNVPMREPFAIAGGAQTKVENVLVRILLADGTEGWGEAAPMPAFNKENQSGTLKAVRAQTAWLKGFPVDRREDWGARLGTRLARRGAARAGLEMALLDAWCRRRRIPLRTFFGGASSRVETDITIPIVSAGQAARAARGIVRRGVRTLKIKIGRDPSEDADRVIAAARIPGVQRLILDANAGYDAGQALDLLRRLARADVRPDLFEQPVPGDDWEGLRTVARRGKVPVAADESLTSPADALALARTGTVQVLNLKLMKSGLLGCLEIARIARSAGLGLMIGGLIESRLAMTCAAHLAAGFGGFSFVDLDTPLFFARDPMRGVPLRRGGVYDLSRVRAGIGVRPNC